MKVLAKKRALIFSFLSFSITFFGISNVGAALLTASQSYQNGASSSIVMNVEIADLNGTPTLMTSGVGINSFDSFVSGTFISESGYVYSFDENAIINLIDAYVNTPLSDLANGGFATGTVWYHFTLDTSILNTVCNTADCFSETPSEFSEYAIWQPYFSINSGPVAISLSNVPLPPSLFLFLSSLFPLFWFKKQT